MSIPFFIVISGPTGVGKTAFVEDLIDKVSFPLEIVNADMGQLYVPLSIGTAKPDLEKQKVAHHLFDSVGDPKDYTVTQYRNAVLAVMEEITSRGAVPLLVGGSSFYIATLFYPPCEMPKGDKEDPEFKEKTTQELWEQLNRIDSVRATQIHKNDRYRIERALRLWHETGLTPSTCEPLFEPPGRCALYFLNRERKKLNNRIDERVVQMFKMGWVEEVKGLSEEWRQFLLTKKLIGYPEIIKYLSEQELGILPEDSYDLLLKKVSQKTRGYAKRQVTFWKRLKKKLQESDPAGDYLLAIKEVNLTLLSHDLYLNQLASQLEKLYGSAK